MVPMQRGLAAEYFVDPNIFEQESKQIFCREWLCLCRASQLPANHCFQTYHVERVSVLVVRGESGLKAFHNVCRHRGAQLCPDEAGELQNGCIQCPYHAWTYDSDGRLVSAPNMQSEPGFTADEFGLVEIGCVEWNGFVLINFSADRSDFHQQYQPIQRHFDAWRLSELRVGSELTYTVQANWKLLFQNFSECYHCPTVHPKLAQLTPYKSATNDLLQGPFLGGPMLLVDNAETMSTDGRFVGPLLPGVTESRQRQVAYYTVFPTMFISPHPDYVMVHRLYREAPGTTRVVCEFLFDPAALSAGQIELERATEFWDAVNRQDWHVCELVQRGATAQGIPPGPYGPLETVLPQFDEHYLKSMS